MRELNISKCIIKKRKEKGITQEELADYIGVSKASVSKWESGLSYPDILLLPELATYFNVSVDELLGYSPQLTKEDIRKVYSKLSHEFASKPFSEVMDECSKIIKKYYSCFPLLLSMVQLLLNYLTLFKDEKIKKETIGQCVLLCQRVKSESKDVSDIKRANTMEALAEMILGNSEKVIELLDDKLVPYSQEDVMLISSYQMLKETDRANEVNQILLYKSVINILSLLSIYLSLHITEPVLFEKIYSQGIQIIDSFDLRENATNAVYGIHIIAAQGYLAQQNKEKAIGALKQYVDTVCGYKFPLSLKGNKYFNKLDKWLEDSTYIGTESPLDDVTVKKSLIDIVAENPAFVALKEDEKYNMLLKRLKERLYNA